MIPGRHTSVWETLLFTRLKKRSQPECARLLPPVISIINILIAFCCSHLLIEADLDRSTRVVVVVVDGRGGLLDYKPTLAVSSIPKSFYKNIH